MNRVARPNRLAESIPGFLKSLKYRLCSDLRTMGLGGGRREVADVAAVDIAEIVKKKLLYIQYQHHKFPDSSVLIESFSNILPIIV